VALGTYKDDLVTFMISEVNSAAFYTVVDMQRRPIILVNTTICHIRQYQNIFFVIQLLVISYKVIVV
jgi:hypothetical protein